eukprot:Skav212727  [mRNA]  locus=scaffold1734:214940:215431:- [translate_table: standard]
MKMAKAFGQKGDVVDDIAGDWVDKWKMRVVQSVTSAFQFHPECSTVKIYCIEGGKHCNAEMAAVPELKKAIQKEMAQMKRTVRTPLSWLSFEEFEEETSGLTYCVSSICWRKCLRTASAQSHVICSGEMARQAGNVEGVGWAIAFSPAVLFSHDQCFSELSLG